MLSYIIRRILAVIPVMMIVAVFVFLLLRLTPGDPAIIIAGQMATPAQLDAIREALGLADPIHIQFIHWIGALMRGDLGTSLISSTSVSGMIADRIWPSLHIGMLTIFLSVVIAVPMGVIAAWRHRSWIDYALTVFALVGFSVPVFVIGYILIYAFSIELRWLPVQGYVPPSKDLGAFLFRAILPSMALASVYVALIARTARASLLEVLGEDYIRTARAKGVKEIYVLFRHALRNAAVPIMTVIGTGFAMLISGQVVTESLFNIPGLGRLTVDAILARDYPVIQAMILLTSAVYVFVNLLIDITYTLIDPRIRY